MDEFTEAMKKLETNDPDLHKAIQMGVTKKNDENKTLRQKGSVNNEILQGLLTTYGVEDVKKVPEVLSTQNDEFKAIVEQQKKTQETLQAITSELETSKNLLARTTIKDDLAKTVFKDFKDPDYMAELYADKTVKGETGYLTDGKFAVDFANNLGAEKPYLLDKEIAATTKTETTDKIPEAPTTNFTPEDIKRMTPEQREENRPAIIAQATASEGE